MNGCGLGQLQGSLGGYHSVVRFLRLHPHWFLSSLFLEANYGRWLTLILIFGILNPFLCQVDAYLLHLLRAWGLVLKMWIYPACFHEDRLACQIRSGTCFGRLRSLLVSFLNNISRVCYSLCLYLVPFECPDMCWESIITETFQACFCLSSWLRALCPWWNSSCPMPFPPVSWHDLILSCVFPPLALI